MKTTKNNDSRMFDASSKASKNTRVNETGFWILPNMQIVRKASSSTIMSDEDKEMLGKI